jgi:ankyrin repeat protein
MVKLLLTKNDVDPNSKDGGGQTLLLQTAENRHTAVIELLVCLDTVTLYLLVQEEKQTTIKLLLSAKYDVNTRNGLGQTLLYITVSLGHLEITRDLISDRAEINLEDSDSITLLRLTM